MILSSVHKVKKYIVTFILCKKKELNTVSRNQSGLDDKTLHLSKKGSDRFRTTGNILFFHIHINSKHFGEQSENFLVYSYVCNKKKKNNLQWEEFDFLNIK